MEPYAEKSYKKHLKKYLELGLPQEKAEEVAPSLILKYIPREIREIKKFNDKDLSGIIPQEKAEALRTATRALEEALDELKIKVQTRVDEANGKADAAHAGVLEVADRWKAADW